jgi:hypothetical protein
VSYPHHTHHGRGDAPGDEVPAWAVDLYNRVAATEARQERLGQELFELNQQMGRMMTNAQQVQADVEAALAKQAQSILDLTAKLAAAGATVPADVQSVLDNLEASARSVLDATDTSTVTVAPVADAPAPPADITTAAPAPADGTVPAPDGVPSSTDGGAPATDGTTAVGDGTTAPGDATVGSTGGSAGTDGTAAAFDPASGQTQS